MNSMDELTLGEIEEIELLAGRSVDDLFKDGSPKGRPLRVLYFVMKKREDPKFKFEDTESVTQSQVFEYLQGEDSKK